MLCFFKFNLLYFTIFTKRRAYMSTKIGCFQIEDECLNPEEISNLINEKIEEMGISADDVISISQPSGHSITRVFYKG